MVQGQHGETQLKKCSHKDRQDHLEAEAMDYLSESELNSTSISRPSQRSGLLVSDVSFRGYEQHGGLSRGEGRVYNI